jgi:flagellar protein FliS
MNAQTNSALSSYSEYGYKSEIEYADPHRLIQMLFEGALKRIAFAKGAMQRKEVAEKGRFISQTIEIIGGLRASLDMENGGEIASNLESLYEYINRRLVTANLKNSTEILDEVSGLLNDIKSAWDAINQPSPGAETLATAEPVMSETIAFEESQSQPAIENESVEIQQPVNRPAQPRNTKVNRALKAYSG